MCLLSDPGLLGTAGSHSQGSTRFTELLLHFLVKENQEARSLFARLISPNSPLLPPPPLRRTRQLHIRWTGLQR